MKIEFDIKDIDRGEVIDAMAHSLLHRWSEVGSTPVLVEEF